MTRSGRNCLKKGTISLVEYRPRVCMAISATAITTLVSDLQAELGSRR